MIRLKSLFLVFIHDSIMIPIAWLLAYWACYSINGFSVVDFIPVIKLLPLLIIVQAFFYWYFDLYRCIWRFASLPDLIHIVKAVTASCLVIAGLLFWLNLLPTISPSILPIYGILLVVLLSGSRILYRYLKDRYHFNNHDKRVLIIGAGSAGEVLTRDLLRSSKHTYRPIAFIDDAKIKQGKEIHGLRVIGTCGDIQKIIDKENIDCVVIAIPSATAAEMRRIVEICRLAKVSFQTLPNLEEIASGEVTINTLREVAVDDLLGREQVTINWQEVSETIQDKVVLVSGGGGSIGSEICQQIAKLKPSALVVIENCEFNLYILQQKISANFPELSFFGYLGSIADPVLVQKILANTKPNIIFHAAAYKHVPLLEDQIYSAVTNNVSGTKILVNAAIDAQVEKFVFISTDKAVNPTNVMGATKRLAEMICQQCNKQGATQFIVVRFGNVLGSSGSVLKLFKQQLENGGPITVTHPEISRFFMTITEAVMLILQACVLGKGGEIFVLDMGKPIKISYLAEQMIRLSKKEAYIEIIYSGLRPGEKLHEELFYPHEETILTKHKKIFQATSVFNNDNIYSKISNLEKSLHLDSKQEVYKLLHEIIPEFSNVN